MATENVSLRGNIWCPLQDWKSIWLKCGLTMLYTYTCSTYKFKYIYMLPLQRYLIFVLFVDDVNLEFRRWSILKYYSYIYLKWLWKTVNLQLQEYYIYKELQFTRKPSKTLCEKSHSFSKTYSIVSVSYIQPNLDYSCKKIIIPLLLNQYTKLIDHLIKKICSILFHLLI
jgi:hypothetical protein